MEPSKLIIVIVSLIGLTFCSPPIDYRLQTYGYGYGYRSPYWYPNRGSYYTDYYNYDYPYYSGYGRDYEGYNGYGRDYYYDYPYTYY